MPVFKIRIHTRVAGYVFDVKVTAENLEAAMAELQREYPPRKFRLEHISN